MSIIKYFVSSTFLLSNVVFGMVPENEIAGPCPCAIQESGKNELPGPAKKVSKGNIKFAFDFYKAIASEHSSNIALSPYSASSCMGMVSMAAEGETLEQIQKVMHFPKYPLILDFGFRELNHSLTSGMAIGSEPVHLTPTNTIWTQKGITVSKPFLTKVMHFWDGTKEADFENDAEGSRLLINEDVEEKTAGKITDFIPEGSIDSLTRMVVVNTLYLSAPWKTPFKESETVDGIFKGAESDVIVPFMQKTELMNVGSSDSYKIIEVPFTASLSTETELSLFIVLPQDDVSMEQVEAELNHKSLRKAMKLMEMKSVNLKFPRFSISTTAFLKPTLMNMGLTLPFSAEGGFPFADDAGNKLVLSEVIQTVKVDFNEWGATCAAATGGMIGITSWQDPELAEAFSCDRPFIYLVADKTTRSILFMGKVAQPN